MKIIKIVVDQLPADCLMECPLKYDRAGCGKFIDDQVRGGVRRCIPDERCICEVRTDEGKQIHNLRGGKGETGSTQSAL
jgi:hypothetical protein